LRDKFDDFETEGQKLSKTTIYKTSLSRKRKRVTRYDYDDNEERRIEEAAAVPLSANESFKLGTYLPIIDAIFAALNKRLGAYTEVHNLFQVVLNLSYMHEADIQNECQRLAMNYPTDLCCQTFPAEMCQFLAFARERGCTTPQSQASIVDSQGLQQTFPNVDIALRMALSVMATNCSGERSFSKLKIIKNKLRSSMNDTRLSSLALLSIESELLRSINLIKKICYI